MISEIPNLSYDTNRNFFFSRAIKLYTRYNYNHTSIGLDKELKELYSFGRRNYICQLHCSNLFENKLIEYLSYIKGQPVELMK